jgi:hypothetical protein
MSKHVADLEALREMLAGNRIHLTLARVDSVEVLADASGARVTCTTLPHELEMVAVVTYSMTGPETGIYGGMPIADDLVLVGLTDADSAFIVARLNTTDEKLPAQAVLGHLIAKARAGKKAYIASDTGVYVGRGGAVDAAEPLILGAVMKSYMTDMKTRVNDSLNKLVALIDKLIAGPVGVGNLGNPVPIFPALATDLGALKIEITAVQNALAADKTKYVDTAATNVVSQIAFTER